MTSINTVLLPNLAEELCPIAENFIVVFADYSTDRIALINQLGPGKKPVVMSYRYVKHCINSGLINGGTLETKERHGRPDAFFTQTSIKKRDEQYHIILPLIENIENFLFSTRGSELIKELAKSNGKLPYQIYTWFYSYLRGGQSKNSLLPNYTNGSRPEEKKYSKKLGRPRKHGQCKGKNIDANDKANILKILRKHFLRNDGLILSECYEKLRENHYCKNRIVNANGDVSYELKDEDETPSKAQFYHWTKKLLKKLGINCRKERMGSISFAKDLAGRNGNIVRPDGPGQIYQLDSTPSNKEMISEFSRDRTLRVGRATVYILVDAFCSGTVGLHTTLAPPSWVEARIAIFNAIRSKVDYCLEIGLEIKEEDWPMSGVPMIIYVDNQELANKLSEGVPASLCTIKFGRVWRGDDKGLVEKAHDLHSEGVKSGIPGTITKKAGERGVRSAKEEALVTLREFTRCLVKVVIQRNNYEELDGKWMIREMIKDGVHPIARDVHQWGELNRPFTKKYIPDDEIYLQLLEKGEAAIRKEGIYFNKLWYRSDWTLSKGLQDAKPHGNKAIPIEVRYFRYNTNYLLLCTDEGFKLAVLHESSRKFENISFDEVETQYNQEQSEKADRSRELYESRADLNSYMDTLVANAKKEQSPLSHADVKNQNINDNKSLDLSAERSAESNRFEKTVKSTFSLNAPVADDASDPNQAEDQVPTDKQTTNHHSAMSSLLKDLL